MNALIRFLPAAAAFALMILCGDKASAAALTGLRNCLRSVIPSLFPFLVLTNLLLRLELPDFLTAPAGKAFEALFGIRRSALPAFLAGMTGGYPVGADAAAEACRLGHCSREEAERLVVFANNCSPGFLFGLVARVLPAGMRQAVILLLLQWLISSCLGVLLGVNRQPSRAAESLMPDSQTSFSAIFTVSVRNGGRSVLLICAYVVFFSVFSAFLPPSALLRGTLEMTGGILLLKGSPWAVTAAAFLIGWGGLSVTCQVYSALEGSGISARRYLPLRLLHGLLMALGAFLMRFGLLWLLLYAAGLIAAALFTKCCRNPAVFML